MFGKQQREPSEVMKPTIIVPTLGTGPMMLLRTLGLDPEQLFQTFQGLEQVLRGAIGEVQERSRMMAERMDANAEAQLQTRSEVERINARLEALEAANTQIATDVQAVLKSLAELHRATKAAKAKH